MRLARQGGQGGENLCARAIARQTGVGLIQGRRRCVSDGFDAEHQLVRHLAPPRFQPTLQRPPLPIGEDAGLLGLQSLEQFA
jgi:hypothetical protein